MCIQKILLRREYQKKWRLKNHEHHKRYQRQYRLKRQEEFNSYKISLGCSRCGYNKYGAALDFHHPDKNKERRIAAKTYLTKLGQLEMKKCILLCANCHREEHYHLRNKKKEQNGDVYDLRELGLNN